MKNQKVVEKNIDFLIIILFIFPFFGGLNKFHIIFSMDVILLIGLLYKIIRNGFVRYTRDSKLIALLIFSLAYLVVSIYAADKTNALLGFFKFATIPIFIFLVMQFDLTKDEKNTLLNTVSFSGATMVIISLLLFSMGNTQMFLNNRFAGVFGYANSFAMWLLAGIIIMACKNNLKWSDFIVLNILMIGIILTNSRSIIILSVVTYLATIIFNKESRKELLINSIIMIVVGIVTYFILTKFGIFSRIVTGTSSEGLLRLLYYKDALRMIKDNIFGYGYLSWWYMQPSFQTGVYYAQYMHNSFLQIVFDAGIIPALAIVYIFIKGFFDKKSGVKERILMVVILAHAMIDFDMEFIAIALVLFLALNFDDGKVTCNVKPLQIGLSCMLILYGYFYFITLFQFKNQYVTVNEIYPFWSQAQEGELALITDEKEKLAKAYKVEKLSKYYKQSHYVISEHYQSIGEFDKAHEYEKEVVLLNKYNLEVYEKYIEFLKKAIEHYSSNGDIEKVNYYKKELVEVPEIINNVLETSDSLAFIIEHKPELNLSEETLKFIETAK